MKNNFTPPRTVTVYAVDLKIHIVNGQAWLQRNIVVFSGPPGCMHTFITGAWLPSAHEKPHFISHTNPASRFTEMRNVSFF